MDISIRGSKVTITKAMEEYATEKLKKLDKYVESPEDVKATVIVKIPNHLHKVEITIPMKTIILRAEEEKEDFYAAIDVLVDKLERQIRKNKTRLQSKKLKEAKEFAFDYIEEMPEVEEDTKIVKRKKVEVKPMDEEEAILQMELLNHDFFVFKNVDEECVSVMYKRRDGNYGIINVK